MDSSTGRRGRKNSNRDSFSPGETPGRCEERNDEESPPLRAEYSDSSLPLVTQDDISQATPINCCATMR